MKQIPLKGGDEYDALNRVRHIYGSRKPGAMKAAKTKYNKRFRRAAKAFVRHEVQDALMASQ